LGKTDAAKRRRDGAGRKEYLRRWLSERGFTGDGPIPPIPDEIRVEATLRYIEAVETLTGEAFVPNTEEPIGRMRRNLGIGG
jgi:phosphoribosylaminoimidazole-succinocarboxamide synthase